MIDVALNYLADFMDSYVLLAPLIVLLAGLLTSFLPCCLASIPLIVGYMGFITETDEGDKKKLLRTVLVFALGQMVSFTALGVAAALLGKLFTLAGPMWFVFLGVLLVVMGLQVMDVVHLVKPIHIKSEKKGLLGAFTVGLVGGAFSSPCATPVLVAIVGYITSSGNVAYGVLLMAMYGIGNNFLVVLSGLSTGAVTKILNGERYKKYSSVLKYVMGSAIIAVALYLLWLGF